MFNLFENFGKVRLGAVCVVGLLDLLEVPYVGGGPGEFFIQQDKAITKKLLAFDKIQFPDFVVFSRNAEFEAAGRLRMPIGSFSIAGITLMEIKTGPFASRILPTLRSNSWRSSKR